MPCTYPKHTKSKEGIFGPTPAAPPASAIPAYKPAYYHGRSVTSQKHKAKWCIGQNGEYEIFLNGYGAEAFIADGSVLWHHCGCECEVGQKGQHLAFFPVTSNDTDPWHGYPVWSDEVGNQHALFEKWRVNGVISKQVERRLSKGQI